MRALTRLFSLAPLRSLLVLGTLLGCKDSTAPDPGPDDPCVASGTIVLGTPIAASLADTDCELAGGYRNDLYTFTTTQQRAVRFSQTSAAFDTYLEIFGTDGSLLGANDDSADVRDIPTSTFKMILPPGTYELSPSSYDPDTTGAYSLSAISVPESENVCERASSGSIVNLPFAMPGITTVGELATGDCMTTGTAPFLFETFVVGMKAGRTYTFSLNSTAFDTFLVLTTLESGQQVAQNDDANGTNSRITFTPTVTDFYALFVSTKNSAAAGAYTLIVE